MIMIHMISHCGKKPQSLLSDVFGFCRAKSPKKNRRVTGNPRPAAA
jgi:hypothetical protein